MQGAGGVLIEHDPFADAQVIETMETETRVAMECPMGKPFDDHCHGEDCLAVENVGTEKRVAVHGEGESECFLEALGRMCCDGWCLLSRHAGDGNDLHRGLSGGYFPYEEIS